MLTYFNRLGKAASVAFLTVGVTVAAAPVQKASAQVTGAGSGAVTTLLKDNTNASGSGPVWDYVNSFGATYNYFVTGSGTGRAAFVNGSVDFVYTDGIGISFGAGTKVLNNTIVNSSNTPIIDPISGLPYVVVNEATLNVALPVNLNGNGISLTVAQACSVILGTVTNWNQVGGPNLAIRRVAFGDNSGTTATLNSGFVVPFCGTAAINNPPVNSAGQSTLPNPRNGTTDPISGKNDSDIIVLPPANPFGTADHSNPNSYSLGVVNTVKATNGAAGYAETAVANYLGAKLAINTGSGLSTIGVGPTYGIFRRNYSDPNKAAAARDVCYGSIFSGYEGNKDPIDYPKQAGFNINNAGAQLPYSPLGSTEQGTDTDNYGNFTTNLGPCSTI